MVHLMTELLRDDHLFRFHLMLREILHINHPISSQAIVEGQITELDIPDLHSLHQFTTEMKSCSGSHYRSLMAGKDVLVPLRILRFGTSLQIFRDGCLTNG